MNVRALSAIALLTAIPMTAQVTYPRVSPKTTVTQSVGLTDVTVTYSRPAVKGRQIWGQLVPHGEVWRTGANEATLFKVSDDVTINGQKLAAGSYSLHTVPGPNEWTIIFNRTADQWGSYEYKQDQDALRVTAKPQSLQSPVELLTIGFPDVQLNSATATIEWDKVRVPFTIGVDTEKKTLAAIKSELAKQEDWRIPYQAANFAFNNGMEWSESQQWIDRSVGIKKTAQNLGLKARMLSKAGKSQEAIRTAEEAIAVGKAAEPKVDTSALEKLVGEWKAKK